MFYRPQLIRGKWNGRSYQVQQELGRGATGTVYLVSYQGQSFALKLSDDVYSISTEVNVLKHFEKAQGQLLGPSVYDVDDWQDGGKIKPFYVMNVIEGQALSTFIKIRGREWLPVLLLQLLDFLASLHRQGFVFGDLKPENLKVVGQPPRMAWLDPGGMTKLGWSIKEYTETYDRGSWYMGDRKAEPAYDLFSVAIIFLYLYSGRMIQPKVNPPMELAAFIFQNNHLFPYQDCLWAALTGRIKSAQEMRRILAAAWLSTESMNQRAGAQKRQLRSYGLAFKKQKVGQSSYFASQPKNQRKKRQPASLRKKRRRSILNVVSTFFFLTSFFILLFALYLWAQSI